MSQTQRCVAIGFAEQTNILAGMYGIDIAPTRMATRTLKKWGCLHTIFFSHIFWPNLSSLPVHYAYVSVYAHIYIATEEFTPPRSTRNQHEIKCVYVPFPFNTPCLAHVALRHPRGGLPQPLEGKPYIILRSTRCGLHLQEIRRINQETAVSTTSECKQRERLWRCTCWL